jgi:hypothetical protein
MAGDSELRRESSADARDPQQVRSRFGRSQQFGGEKSLDREIERNEILRDSNFELCKFVFFVNQISANPFFERSAA